MTHTHANLVKLAAKWLSHAGCRVILEEPRKRLGERLAGEVPDVVGWLNARQSYVVEVKVSEADFKADAKKPHRQHRAMGRYRYYFTPAYLIEPHQLPEGWGLLWLTSEGVTVKQEAEPWQTVDSWAEMGLLLTALAHQERASGRTANEARPSNIDKPTAAFVQAVARYVAETGETDPRMIRLAQPGLVTVAGNKPRCLRWIERVLEEAKQLQGA